jgi:large subunit ribosomal protein L21
MFFRTRDEVLFPLEAKVYAIIETGGKQYRVQEGDVIAVELLKGDAGDVIALERVLLVGGDETTVGAPLVSGAVVNAKIVEHGRDDKKITFRYHNKNRYRVKKGHRQPVTRLEIQSISL